MESLALLPARKSFDDIRDNRVRCPPELRSKVEALVCRKRFYRQGMQGDVEVVCALPGDQRLMTKGHSTRSEVSNSPPTVRTHQPYPPHLPYLPHQPYHTVMRSNCS
jgi:hypothetical protein